MTDRGVMHEIAESEASGELVRIYDELRIACAVPYVSSLQRHVATMPGCLEYAWAVCRPAFLNGRIPETAWRLATRVETAPFPPISHAAMRLLGVDAEGVRAIRNVCENFVRVAPINLLFAGVLERLIGGAVPGRRGGSDAAWTPPDMLPSMPPMVDIESLGDDVRSVLLELATELGGRTFVPGLYRLLAPWPGYLAHAATLIAPLLASEEERARRVAIAETIVGAADDILAELDPPSAALVPPSAEQARAIVRAIHTYRVTSPEMIVIGGLLADALPPSG